MSTTDTKRHTKVINILLVESDPGDALLIQRAFELGTISNKIYTVKSGEEALAFLRQEGTYIQSPKPDMILLDFDAPGLDVSDFLTIVKGAPDLLMIPVIGMTFPTGGNQVEESYKHHVNCVISKPIQVRGFLDMIKAVDYFWTELVTLTDEPPK